MGSRRRQEHEPVKLVDYKGRKLSAQEIELQEFWDKFAIKVIPQKPVAAFVGGGVGGVGSGSGGGGGGAVIGGKGTVINGITGDIMKPNEKLSAEELKKQKIRLYLEQQRKANALPVVALMGSSTVNTISNSSSNSSSSSMTAATTETTKTTTVTTTGPVLKKTKRKDDNKMEDDEQGLIATAAPQAELNATAAAAAAAAADVSMTAKAEAESVKRARAVPQAAITTRAADVARVLNSTHFPASGLLRGDDWDSRDADDRMVMTLDNFGVGGEGQKQTLVMRLTPPPESESWCISICPKHHEEFMQVLYHFNPRQRERGGILVENDRQLGRWGNAKRTSLRSLKDVAPLFKNTLDLACQINDKGFHIAIDGVYMSGFLHRTPIEEWAADQELVLELPNTDDYGKVQPCIFHQIWWGYKPPIPGMEPEAMDVGEEGYE